MQDNYIDAFNQMLDFFKSIKPDLTEIKQRLDRLEKLTIFIPTDISSMKSIFTSDKFRRSLPLPMNGNSFGGSTFEQIAAALPSNSLAVKFVNYMETDLTGYKFDLYGFPAIEPPSTVSPQTVQVATFKAEDKFLYGTMMYRIGSTNKFIHVFFDCHTDYRIFAAAFLSDSVPQGIGHHRCRRPDGPNDSFRCHANVPFDTKKSLLIHEGNMYANVAVIFSASTSTLTVDVFEFMLEG